MPRRSKMPVVISPKRPDKTATSNAQRIILEIMTLLGVSFDLRGDSSSTGARLIKKAQKKIRETPFPPKASPITVRNIAKTYIINSMDWADLLSKITIAHTDKLDKELTKRIRQPIRLGKKDSAINIFREISKFGLGLQSFSDRRLISLLREIDVVLHKSADHGCALRSSNDLSSKLKPDFDMGFERFLPFNLKLLAKYGYFLRDSHCLLESIVIKKLLKIEQRISLQDNKHILHPVGDFHFDGAARFTSPYLGDGDKKLEKYTMKGTLDCEVNAAMRKCWVKYNSQEKLTLPSGWKDVKLSGKLERPHLAQAFKEAKASIEHSTSAPYGFFEWHTAEKDEDPLVSPNWTDHSVIFDIDLSSDAAVWEQIRH